MKKTTKTKEYVLRCLNGSVTFWAGDTKEQATKATFHSAYHKTCPEGSHKLLRVTTTTVEEEVTR